MMRSIIHWHKRPIIYAMILTAGFSLLADIAKNASGEYFLRAALFLYLLLLFELYSTSFFAKDIIKQLSINASAKESLTHYIHHLVLPSLFFASAVSFTFFHHLGSTLITLLIIILLIFAVLFNNIHAYYRHELKLEERTHYVYDVLSVILIFLATVGVLESFIYFDLQKLGSIAPLLSIFGILGALTLMRYYDWHLKYFQILFSFVFLSCIAAIILIVTTQQPMLIACILALIYYYFLSFIHHVDRGDISKKIIAEYVIVFLLSVIVVISV